MWEWNDGNDALIHYGIKGQKWGVRRFQNEDGSLTALGRYRYGLLYGQTKSEYRKQEVPKMSKSEYVEKRQPKMSRNITSTENRNKVRAEREYGKGHFKKTTNFQRRKMSSESLKKRAERLRLEKEVKNLEKEVNATGYDWAKDALKSIAKKTAVQIGTSIAVSAALQWITTGNVDLSTLKIPTPKDQW